MSSPAETGIRTRAFADKAVQAALEADWPTAVELNAKILEANAEDLEARNRLGRALLETGKLDEAKAAYADVLKAEPNNPIALRNVARLGLLLEHKTKTNPTKSKTQPRLFIEDMGKTGILRLINPAPAHVVAKYSPGAEAELRERDGLIAVHARDGELLGFLGPKVGRRLLDLLNTGNEYVVAVVSNDQQNPRVAIRETLQSPENACEPAPKVVPSGDVPDAPMLARGTATVLLQLSAYDYGLAGNLSGQTIRAVSPERWATVVRTLLPKLADITSTSLSAASNAA